MGDFFLHDTGKTALKNKSSSFDIYVVNHCGSRVGLQGKECGL